MNRGKAWDAAACAVAAIGTAGAFAILPTPDVTWLLFASGRVLDGARLGVDVVENSPPVILWLKMPSVLLSRATGWDPWLVWVVAVSLLGVACLIACRFLLRSIRSLAGSAGLLLTTIAVGLFLLPMGEFGQRELVAVCLVLPWLLALAARLEGADLGVWRSWALALAGGLGLSIKPHFGLVWLAVAVVVLWRRRSPRALLLPELAGAALVPALAVAATLMVHPEWMGYARLYGPLYQQFGREDPIWVGLVGEGAEWSWLGVLALLAFAPVLKPLPASLTVLAAGLAGFHLAAAVQMKGWGYHFIPAGAIGLLTAAAAGACGAWRGDRLVRRVYRVAVPLGIAVAAWGGLRGAATRVARPESRWDAADPGLRALLAEVRRSGRRETLLVLSTNIGSGFPLAHLAAAEWTMRHPSLWALGAIYSRELRDSGLVRTRGRSAWTADERRLVHELEADVAKRPPTLVIVPEPDAEAPGFAISRRLDYRPYLDGIAGLARLRAVRPRRTGGYLIWRVD